VKSAVDRAGAGEKEEEEEEGAAVRGGRGGQRGKRAGGGSASLTQLTQLARKAELPATATLFFFDNSYCYLFVNPFLLGRNQFC